ncbi:uncharacterized protein LOC128387538 [Panonychus citri]|uniref:uncharacterized protein LOC128387538 n=1 Tax=Panonychus citri TaxID=50023 RepID=UPI002306EC17|nr:uncharacterized protein LOC128387538 [Panonychus citri]
MLNMYKKLLPLVNKLFPVICLIGCSLQLIVITRDYLKFPVIESIDISFPVRVEIPAFTICTQFINAINWTYFLNHHSNLVGYLNCTLKGSKLDQSNQLRSCFFDQIGDYYFQSFVEKHFTINQFYKMVIKSEQLITSQVFWSENGTYDGLQLNDRVNCYRETFLKDPHVCYHIRCRNKINPNESVYLSKSDLNYCPSIGGIYSLGLNRDLFDHWDHAFIFIHSTKERIYGPEASSILINPLGVPTIFYFSYKRSSVQLLSAPYETNCKVYRDIDQGIESADHLFEMCINNQTIKLSNFILYQTIISQPDKLYYGFSNRRRFNYSQQLSSIYNYCFKFRVKSECQQSFYVPILNGLQKIDPRSNQSFALVLAPFEPDLTKSSIPKLSSVDYFVYVGSVMSTWFGFSIYKHFTRFFSNLIPIYQNKVNCARQYLYSCFIDKSNYQQHNLWIDNTKDNQTNRLKVSNEPNQWRNQLIRERQFINHFPVRGYRPKKLIVYKVTRKFNLN